MGRCARACGRLPVPSGAVGSVCGAAGAIGIWRNGGRVLVDGHFSARTSAALPPPPKNLVLARQVFGYMLEVSGIMIIFAFNRGVVNSAGNEIRSI